MNYLELKSPHNGSLLTCTIKSRFEEGVDFDVKVATPFFSGTAPSSTFMAAPLGAWFQEMADAWAGWSGEKSWADLESRVLLSSTTDSTGHITMGVTLMGQDYDSVLRVNIMFDAGQLEDMARNVRLLFS